MAKLLKKLAVLEVTGLKTTTLYARMKDGTFPRPRRVGPNSVAWLSTDIDDWMKSLLSADPADSNAPKGKRKTT